MKELYLNHTKDLPRVAREFLLLNPDRKMFAFFGELGAGKTTFIKALCSELNVIDVVSSPTFSIINEYQTDQHLPVYHMDFYRINKISEAYEIGIEDYFSGKDFCFIEWPEKIEELLPEEIVYVNITINDQNGRVLSIS